MIAILQFYRSRIVRDPLIVAFAMSFAPKVVTSGDVPERVQCRPCYRPLQRGLKLRRLNPNPGLYAEQRRHVRRQGHVIVIRRLTGGYDGRMKTCW